MNLNALNDSNLLLYLAVCCVVPVVLLIIVSLMVIRTGQRWVTPDLDELRGRFEKLRTQNPNLTTDQLVQKIIQQQAMRAGVVGAISSVGGLFLLPFGLIIDLYTSARIQSTMLHFIAWAYSLQAPNRTVNIIGLNEALVLKAEERAQQFVLERSGVMTQRLYRQVIQIIVEKTFAKLIPGIGLLIGFLVNYSIARGIGTVAAQWYSGRLAKQAEEVGRQIGNRNSPQLPR
jgi:hypothetical protein